jgi:hypothetical protein
MVNKERIRISQKRRQITINMDSAEANIISESSEGDASDSWGGMNLRQVSIISNNQSQYKETSEPKEVLGKAQLESKLRKLSVNIINKNREQIRKVSSPEVMVKRKNSDPPSNVTQLVAKCYGDQDNYLLLNESIWNSYDEISTSLFTDNEFPTTLATNTQVKWLRAKDMNPSNYKVSVFIDTISHENVT